jgi:hypothetical protein
MDVSVSHLGIGTTLERDNVGTWNDSSAYHWTKDECILGLAEELC